MGAIPVLLADGDEKSLAARAGKKKSWTWEAVPTAASPTLLARA
jgi:hypothetical protein